MDGRGSDVMEGAFWLVARSAVLSNENGAYELDDLTSVSKLQTVHFKSDLHCR